MPVPTDPTGSLFTASDLTEWLGKPVTDARAAVVERVVWGWLKGPLGAGDTRPQSVPDEVFSWAVELGAIAHENPAGLSARQLGSNQQQFSAERRAAILAEVAAGATSNAGAALPLASFPEPQPFPDPAWW